MKSRIPSSTKRKPVHPSLTRRFETFLGKKRHSAHVMSGDDFEADAPSRPIVRLVVVLLLLHVIVVGGILVRGQLAKSSRVVPLAGTHTVETAVQPASDTSSQNGADNTLVVTGAETPAEVNVPLDLPQPEPRPPAALDNALVDEPVFGAGTAVPTITPDRSIRSSASQRVTHLVLSGDTWETVARDYGCTVQELKAANPGVTLSSNTSIVIPPPPGVVMAELVDEDGSQGTRTYTIKKNDNLTKIAREYKTTVPAIMKINNFSEADTRRLRPGQEIKLP